MNSTVPPQDPRPDPPPQDHSPQDPSSHDSAEDHPGQSGTNSSTRRLYRDSSGPLRGVATGLAHYFGIDPVLVQIGFVLLTIFGGSGILIYLAGWLLIPEADFQDPNSTPSEPGAASVVIGALVLVAAVALIMSFIGLGFAFDGSVFIWLLLLGAGVFLLNQRPEEMSAVGASMKDLVRPANPTQPWAEPRTDLGPTNPAQTATPPPPPGPAMSPMATTNIDAKTGSTVGPIAGSPVDPTSNTGWAIPPPAPSHHDLTQRLAAVGNSTSDLSASFKRPTSPVPKPIDPGPPITSVTLALAAVLVGLLAGLNQLSGVEIGAGVLFGSVLAMCGLGLLFASVKGRAWGLVPVALIAFTGMVTAPITDLTINGGFGERDYTPQNHAELKDHYQLAAGELTVDLTDIDFDSDTTIKVELGAGSVIVLVPEGVKVDAKATSNFGEVSVFGHFESGVDVAVHRVEDETSTPAITSESDQPTLTIRAETTFGEVEIRHAN